MARELDYGRLSSEMGLHKDSLDYIRNKSTHYLESISKLNVHKFAKPSFRDKLSVGVGKPAHTERGIINGSDFNKKVKNALDFMVSSDKQKTGLIPVANFLKVLRIFGIQVNQSQIEVDTMGMVEYEPAVGRSVKQSE
jgi:hypothetical protein